MTADGPPLSCRDWLWERGDRLRNIQRGLRFLLRRREREFLTADSRRLVGAQDQLAFARRVFGRGPSQLDEEILAFLEYARPNSPAVVCEIGTQDGGTAFLLGQLPTVDLLIGIDLHPRNRRQLRHFRRPAQQVHVLKGSSSAPRTKAAVERWLGDRMIDLLFVDGDHRLEGVRRDFARYRHLVREGGLIAFHDIVPDHAARFGTRTRAWSGAVPEVWRRLRELYPTREFVRDAEQDGYGIGVILYSAKVRVPADW